jgi:hypothetical protein
MQLEPAQRQKGVGKEGTTNGGSTTSISSIGIPKRNRKTPTPLTVINKTLDQLNLPLTLVYSVFLEPHTHFSNLYFHTSILRAVSIIS